MGSEATPSSEVPRTRWLNRTVVGVGLASLLSDCSHEIATTVLPAFLATMGVAAAWLGLIEGVADGLSSLGKMASGFFTDRLPRRQPIAVIGYTITALGTASFGLATTAWHVLLSRSLAWLGRGVRTPIRKALLAGAVDRSAYGRAFGFERMMDTCGAIVGPATAFVLLQGMAVPYKTLFALTLIPGLLAAFAIGFVVQEKERRAVAHVTLGDSLRALTPEFRRFLAAVGLFGAGDFAHTLLILLAAQKLSPLLGPTRAAAAGAGLYLLHNVLNAAAAFGAGQLADRVDKRTVLAGGYLLAFLMAVGIMTLPAAVWAYAVVFGLGGVFAAVVETAEDSLCADLAARESHGMAFGTLATVNGVGDFLSSTIVGLLWTAAGTTIAFAYSAALFLAGGAVLLAKPFEPPAGTDIPKG